MQLQTAPREDLQTTSEPHKCDMWQTIDWLERISRGRIVVPKSDVCGKPAKYWTVTHEAPGCELIEGYECEECYEDTKNDKCYRCGAAFHQHVRQIG